MSETEATAVGGERTYGGLPGSFRYSFHQSDSRLYRSYAVVSGLLGLLITALVGLGLIVWIFQTADQSALVTLVRSFLVLVGLLIVIPLFAPVLFVARRHRKRFDVDERYDVALAAGGYCYVASLYVGLVITVPPDQQTTPAAAIAPIVELLYALPPAVGLIPPVLAAIGIYALHRRFR